MFHFFFERFERVVPKLVDPAPQFAKAVWIDVIHAARTLGSIGDEPGCLQGFEMLRNGGAADRQTARKNAHRLRAGAQSLEHPASRRIAQTLKDRCVSHSLP